MAQKKAVPKPWGWGHSRPSHSPRGIFLQWHFAMCQPFVSPPSRSLCAPQLLCLDTYLQQCLLSKGQWWEWQSGCGRGKEKAWIQGKRLGAEGGTVIKHQGNQRKGRLTARKRLRYKVASLSGTCPLLREAQGPDQEKKEGLKDRRQEKGLVNTRLSNNWARHPL